jgi:hypothetical protein
VEETGTITLGMVGTHDFRTEHLLLIYVLDNVGTLTANRAPDSQLNTGIEYMVNRKKNY